MSVTTTSVYSCATSGSAAAHAKRTAPAIMRAAAWRIRARADAPSRRRAVKASVERPKRPCGRMMSTPAMMRNSATSVSLGNAIVIPPTFTDPSAMQSALERPISNAATNAPGIDPRPPITVTTNASAMIERSMPRLAGSRGSCSAPASPARPAPSANTRSEKDSLVDAQRGGEDPVFSRGADQHAEARARHQPPQREQHGRSDDDEQQIVGRHRAARDVDDSGESGRARAEQVLRAPAGERRVLHDQHDAERRQQLQQLRPAIKPAQQRRLEKGAERGDEERRQCHRAPVAQRRAAHALDQAVGRVRAQHHERAVREVDDARDAEDQRQSRRDQEQRRSAGETVEDLDQQSGERHPRIMAAARSAVATRRDSERGRGGAERDQSAGRCARTQSSEGR